MKLFALTILFFLTQSYVFCESNKEEKIYQEDNPEILDTAFVRIIYKVGQQALNEGVPFIVIDTMALDVGKKWSVYYDLFHHYKDSVNNYNFLNNSPREYRRISTSNQAELDMRLESGQEIYKMEVNARISGETARIYKNRQENEVMTVDNGPLEGTDTYTLFRFTEKIKPQGWTISEDTCTVLNYLCQKATTSFRGRDYTVWFTLDISIHEGPWKLHGLPGLILKAEDSEKIFCFEAIGLQELKNTPIEINRKLKLYQKGRHLSIMKKFIGGDLKKWQAFKRAELRKLTVSFLDPDAVSVYLTKNPIVYPEIEIIE